jgi:hypothetical protein
MMTVLLIAGGLWVGVALVACLALGVAAAKTMPAYDARAMRLSREQVMGELNRPALALGSPAMAHSKSMA